MQIFYSENINDNEALLTTEEAGHCSRVLRKRVGDTINVTDGNGKLYSSSISEMTKKEVILQDLKLIESQDDVSSLIIAIAPTKNIARFEWFLEKATEIGVKTIIPILTKRSERKVLKPERCYKILLSAMKQSKNLYLPKLYDLVKFEQLFALENIPQQKYIAHCMEPEKHLGVIYNAAENGIVMIGPEGDFTPDELELCKKNEWQEVSLGPSRLRTETAGIVAAHVVSMVKQGLALK